MPSGAPPAESPLPAAMMSSCRPAVRPRCAPVRSPGLRQASQSRPLTIASGEAQKAVAHRPACGSANAAGRLPIPIGAPVMLPVGWAARQMWARSACGTASDDHDKSGNCRSGLPGAVHMTTQSRAQPLAVVSVSSLSTAFSVGVGLAPGFIASALRADLGIHHWHVGLLVSLHFGCTGLASVPAGRITDRWGARFAVVTNLALSALAAGLAAALGSYPALLVAAVLSGFGYALSGVGTSVAVVRAVGERRRTAAMVATNAGLPAIVAVSAFAGPWVADRWRWEWVLGALGVGAAVAALLALRTLGDDRPERHDDLERRLPKHFGWFPVAAFLMLSGFAPTLAWSVSYIEEALGATPTLSGVLVGVAAAITFVSLIVSSLLADRVDPQTRIRLVAALSTNNRMTWAIFGFVRYRIRLVMTLCLVRALFGALILAGVAFGAGVAVAGIVGGMIVQTACFGAMYAAVADRAPRSVARATSLTMVGSFLGALVGPVAFGAFIDAGGSYGWAWSILCLLLIGAAMALRLAGWIAPPRRAKAPDPPSVGAQPS